MRDEQVFNQRIEKLVGWDCDEDGVPAFFYFLDAVYDLGYVGTDGRRMCDASGTELVGITPFHLAWLQTDEGLIYRFEDYDEMTGKNHEEIIAWGKDEIAAAIEADGDPYERLFDTSYRAEYWPLLRAAGFSEEQYPAFECVGSVWGKTWREMQHVHDPEAHALALEWAHCQKEVAP